MKNKLIICFTTIGLLLTHNAFADGWRGGESWRGGEGWHGGEGWGGDGGFEGAVGVGAAVLGGLVGGMLAQQPTYAAPIAPAPVYAPPPGYAYPAPPGYVQQPAYAYPVQPTYVQPAYPAPSYGGYFGDDD